MEITLQQYECIQRYLDGLMTSGEEQSFLEEVKKSSLLEEHLRFERDLRDNLLLWELEKGFPSMSITQADLDTDFENADNISARIEKSGKEYKAQKRPLKIVNDADKKIISIESRRKLLYALAAACIILFVAGIIWFLSSDNGPKPGPIVRTEDSTQHKSHDTVRQNKPELPGKRNIYYASLSAKYYKKEAAPDDKPQLLANALTNYDENDYSIIQELNLNKLPISRGVDEKQQVMELGHYYKGLSFIETNNSKQAIENLQWVVDSAKNEILVVKVQWYLGLTYLKAGNINKSNFLFTILANNPKAVPYNRQAKELLRTLEGKN